MKISTSKTELQLALQKLSKATPARSTLPILSSVLFDVQESGTVLRATDLEITIVANLPTSIEKNGSIAVPLQTLLDVTNELPESARITLSSDENNKIEMVTDVGVYDIMGKPAEEFPAIPEVDNRKSVGISSDALSGLIRNTSFAVSRDELKPALTGVLFRFGQAELTGVATDGHRLVRYVRNDYQADEFLGDVIVPKKFLSLLSSVLKVDESIQLWMGDNHMTALINGDTYFTRIIDERFPDFDSVIPKDNDKELIVDQIALRLSSDQIKITTEDPEKSSKAEEQINGEYSGDELVIGYNASYLKDILSHARNDKINIKLKTAISAALFHPIEDMENEKLTMLLMPIRLND